MRDSTRLDASTRSVSSDDLASAPRSAEGGELADSDAERTLDQVAEEAPLDLSGRWVGTWKGWAYSTRCVTVG